MIHQPNNRENTITHVIWGFLIGYIGVYIFAFLIGIFCTGAMLLIGSILAAIR
jgi:hypothetical protein